MRILVTFALEPEFAPWRKLHRFRRARLSFPSIFEARIGAADVRVALTGIGAQHAHRVVQLALVEGADVCISSGLAGGLRVTHRTGDILAARSVLAPAGVVFVKSDAHLLQAAIACGAKEASAFFSAGSIIVTAEEKSRLAISADAVEMESYGILTEAERAGVPAVAIRVVGDTAEQNLPLDFNRVVGREGNVQASRLVKEIARRPWSVPALAQLGIQTQRAATRLAEFLDSYVTRLAEVRQHEFDSAVAAT
jgi:adenosylhomocysteine nucleosidase